MNYIGAIIFSDSEIAAFITYLAFCLFAIGTIIFFISKIIYDFLKKKKIYKSNIIYIAAAIFVLFIVNVLIELV